MFRFGRNLVSINQYKFIKFNASIFIQSGEGLVLLFSKEIIFQDLSEVSVTVAEYCGLSGVRNAIYKFMR